MAGLEGCLCSVSKEAAGSVSHLRLVAEVKAGLEGCLCLVVKENQGGLSSVLEKATKSVSLL